MPIDLMEKIVNLGNLSDIVKVKDGYARNFPRHTDVLVDVTATEDKFAGFVGLLDGYMAAPQRGKM